MKSNWMTKARALAKEQRAHTKWNLAAPPRAPVLNDAGNEATIYIYDQIGKDFWTGEGCTAIDVVNAVDAAKKSGATSLAVRILSPGGDCFDGMGILEALKRCGLPTTAFNDGLCASAATMVALGCDKFVAAPTSIWMMHRAWSMAGGHAADMTAMAELLSKLDESIAAVYAEKSGKSVADCLELMTIQKGGPDGNWMTAEECKAAGFADEIGRSGSDGEADPGNDDPETANAVMRLLAETEKRVAANRERIAAAKARLTKIPGASPGSTKPGGQPSGAKK